MCFAIVSSCRNSPKQRVQVHHDVTLCCKSKKLTSLYFSPNGNIESFEFLKYETNNTHGSGCTLSSAIASYLAQGKSLLEAVSLGQEYIHQAIYHGKDVAIGKGNGPVNHFFNPQKLIKNEMDR